MGDIANMTDCNGRVSGDRLLRWLRSHAEIERGLAAEAPSCYPSESGAWHQGRVSLLEEMGDDLERELAPPDYPEDDGDTVDLDDPALTVDEDERNQS